MFYYTTISLELINEIRTKLNILLTERHLVVLEVLKQKYSLVSLDNKLIKFKDSDRSYFTLKYKELKEQLPYLNGLRVQKNGSYGEVRDETIRRYYKRLQEAGLLEVRTETHPKTHKTANLFYLNPVCFQLNDSNVIKNFIKNIQNKIATYMAENPAPSRLPVNTENSLISKPEPQGAEPSYQEVEKEYHYKFSERLKLLNKVYPDFNITPEQIKECAIEFYSTNQHNNWLTDLQTSKPKPILDWKAYASSWISNQIKTLVENFKLYRHVKTRKSADSPKISSGSEPDFTKMTRAELRDYLFKIVPKLHFGDFINVQVKHFKINNGDGSFRYGDPDNHKDIIQAFKYHHKNKTLRLEL